MNVGYIHSQPSIVLEQYSLNPSVTRRQSHTVTTTQQLALTGATLDRMSTSASSTLTLLRNPLNVRRGAQYIQLRIEAPVPSVGLGETQQIFDKSAVPVSRTLEASYPTSVLDDSFDIVSLRHGAQDFETLDHLYADDRGIEVDRGEQEKQQSDSDLDIEHLHTAREWYTDDQIAEFIAYTRECLTATPPHHPISSCNITTRAGHHPSPACLMLRDAARAGLAQLARSTETAEVYTVGTPPPVMLFHGGVDAHWWHGLAPAQILAGPLAEKADVRHAEKTLQRNTLAKRRVRWLAKEREKTAEGVRRQAR